MSVHELQNARLRRASLAELRAEWSAGRRPGEAPRECFDRLTAVRGFIFAQLRTPESIRGPKVKAK